jgi:hypothetical protein
MAYPKWFTDESIPRVVRYGDIHPKVAEVSEEIEPSLSLSEKVDQRTKKKAVNVAIERKTRELAKENRKLSKEERVALREQLSKNLRIERANGN